jgi:hypothetical protein
MDPMMGQDRKIKAAPPPRLAHPAPRRNPGLKAGAFPQNQDLAKVLRRPETKIKQLAKGAGPA